MIPRRIPMLLLILVCAVLALSSCELPFDLPFGCDHEWKDATCTAPKTCSLCEETEGEALGHTGGTATCSAKAVCTRCSAEYGELGTAHAQEESWFKKVDTHRKGYKCCGATTTAAEAHTIVAGVCTVCGFDPTISASTPVLSEDGKTATLSILVTDNPGIIGLELTLTFDTNSLTLTSAESGAVTAGLTFSKPDDISAGGKFLWDATDMSDKDVVDGELVKLTFDVSNAAIGEYPLLLRVSAYDSAIAPLSFKILNGTIVISE